MEVMEERSFWDSWGQGWSIDFITLRTKDGKNVFECPGHKPV